MGIIHSKNNWWDIYKREERIEIDNHRKIEWSIR